MAASSEAEASVGADRTTSRSVGEDFPVQQRLARELLALYREIGPAGAFGAMVIEQALQRADRAQASGDIIAILQSYEELRGLK